MLEKTWELLMEEAEGLRKKLTKEISADIGVGYETGGGWHDNALFESALVDQAVAASKLAEVSRLMQYPVFIDNLEIPGNMVTIGVEVHLEFDGEEAISYQVLGAADARYNDSVISSTSPLAKVIMQHKVGDIVMGPGGKTIKIVGIKKII
ncbi:hypothetical protein GYA54_00980 [Candidatus Kuenenbacteria bacterium]|nr:hypothetical protein [Candidatus Kuenenbacteria bacterium]